MPDASLIISVFNNERGLELIFHALKIQSYKNFEVIIAEDGMEKEISDLLNLWRDQFDLIHLAQEDKGFRKNKILNKSIKNSNSDYLIFIDGDCIPHPDFIKAHIDNKERQTVLCGRRVNLTKKLSSELSKDKILNKDFTKIKLGEAIFSALNRERSNFNIEEGIKIQNKSLRRIITNEDEHILGCNFSIHKQMLIDINGFDENYEGPGLGEDSDIEFRLRLKGAKFKSVRNLAILYHLFHEKTVEEPGNMEYFLKVKNQNKFFCENGLVKQIE